MLALFFTASLLAGIRQPVQPPDNGPVHALDAGLRRIIAASGAEVAVAYRTLDGRTSLFIDADKSVHAASTMKVPVMIELFTQARAGALTLDDPLPVVNTFRSLVDGSPYALATGDASDAEIIAALGRTLPLRTLCEAMITRSSNFATNLLIERLGIERIRRTVASLGADGMHVVRGVEDQKAFDAGLINTTTARALLILLERIANNRAVDPGSDADMVRILARQTLSPDAIAAGVPSGTRVAHKTGSITRIHHDAAIVFAPVPYVLVVLTRGIADEGTSARVMASVSKAVYESAR